MCSDGHDAVCYGNNLSGGFSNADHAACAEELHRRAVFRRPVPQACDSGDREIASVQGRRADRYHVRRGLPTVHLHRQQLRELEARRAERGDVDRGCLGRRDPVRPPRALRADRAEHAAGQGRSRQRAVPGSRLQLVHRSPEQLCVADSSRACRQGPASSAEATIPQAHAPDAAATAAPGSATIADNAAVATDPGRSVTGTGIPAGAFVGKVTDTPVTATAPNGSGGFVDIGSFTLVDASGRLLRTTAAVSGVVLGARTPATDPLYDAKDATTGGGDTGSVLISPYIRPHTTSTVYYNHYSWLRTIEDLFNVGRVSKGLDGQGHIGYAAQRGLAPFGRTCSTTPRASRRRDQALRRYPCLAARDQDRLGGIAPRDPGTPGARDPGRHRHGRRPRAGAASDGGRSDVPMAARSGSATRSRRRSR